MNRIDFDMNMYIHVVDKDRDTAAVREKKREVIWRRNRWIHEIRNNKKESTIFQITN
jgi:hypothetical protein